MCAHIFRANPHAAAPRARVAHQFSLLCFLHAQKWLTDQLETKHFMLSQVYGSHLPMQIRAELETIAMSRRLPGMRTCNIAMETILGRDETIDFEDYLGNPSMSEEAIDMRAVLEKKHGLGPRVSAHSRAGGTPRTANAPRCTVAMVKELGDPF